MSENLNLYLSTRERYQATEGIISINMPGVFVEILTDNGVYRAVSYQRREILDIYHDDVVRDIKGIAFGQRHDLKRNYHLIDNDELTERAEKVLIDHASALMDRRLGLAKKKDES